MDDGLGDVFGVTRMWALERLRQAAKGRLLAAPGAARSSYGCQAMDMRTRLSERERAGDEVEPSS
jgi:hypothetical protein